MAKFSIEPNERVTFKLHHEDDDLLVIEKPAKLVTQPGMGHDDDSLLNGLFVQYGIQLQNLGKARDFGLLHRLDRDASGLLIVALQTRSYKALREVFAKREIKKYYWAVTRRAPNKPEGTIQKPLQEVQAAKKTVRISSAGKAALTAYRVLSKSQSGALVECRSITGRLHQIRAHLDSIGCAILGDDIYGPESVRSAAPRLALHAHRIVFQHPISGEQIDIQTRWPRDLGATLRRFGLPRPDLDVKEAKVAEADD